MKKEISVHKLVYISLTLTVCMIAGRIIYTGNLYGTYLIWNLFLAWLPFMFSLLLLKREQKLFVRYALFTVWLLFFPNAPYIITDLFHLRHRSPVPYWYDLLMLFWASWNGLLLGILSLMNVERYLNIHFRSRTVNTVVNVCLVLCAFGVYAGRYLRWNSWYVVSDPKSIAKDLASIAFNPWDNLRTWGVTFFFSLLMITIYKTMKGLKQYGSNL